jgi:hypothetical protein
MIIFDSLAEIFTYPDGEIETLEQYIKRRDKFDYIQKLQDSLDSMKVLYQNPGCLNESEYNKAKSKIQDEFEWWEANIFNEFGDI